MQDTAELEKQLKEQQATIAGQQALLDAVNRELEAFAYSVSHDLRAPLRAIDGFSRIIDRDYAAHFPQQAQQHFARIRGAAQRMGSLIEGLLDYSRLGHQAMQAGDYDVASIVGAALEALAPGSAHIKVGELGRCTCDKTLLTQVFVNLIGNAIKYMQGRDPARIEVGSRLDASGRRGWFVADNGVGFDMRHAGRLFGMFQRLHRDEDYEGTGVGLAIVRRIVERHGGSVWADAMPQLGTTFHFTLAG